MNPDFEDRSKSLEAFQDAAEAWLDARDTSIDASLKLEVAKSRLIAAAPEMWDDKLAFLSVDGRTVLLSSKEDVISVEAITPVARFM